MTCLDRNVPPFLGAKETCLEHVFSGAHIRHDHKQYCLSSSDPAGKDIWAGLFMVEMFLFLIGKALPKTQQTRESSAFAKLTPIGRRPPPH